MLELKVQRIENLIRKLNKRAALPYGYCSHEIPKMMKYIEELILDLDDASHAFRLQRLLWEEVNSDDTYRENTSSSILG